MQQLNYYKACAITGGVAVVSSTATNDLSNHITRNRIIKWIIDSLLVIGTDYTSYQQAKHRRPHQSLNGQTLVSVYFN